jgi:hypothetical protein
MKIFWIITLKIDGVVEGWRSGMVVMERKDYGVN